jgi:hypothetical protein
MGSNYRIHKRGGKGYRIPTFKRTEARDAVKLYHAESRALKEIDAAARELGEILGFDKSEFWTHSLPEELATILESYDNGAAEAAAIAYLRKAGFTITKNEPEEEAS